MKWSLNHRIGALCFLLFGLLGAYFIEDSCLSSDETGGWLSITGDSFDIEHSFLNKVLSISCNVDRISSDDIDYHLFYSKYYEKAPLIVTHDPKQFRNQEMRSLSTKDGFL